MKKGKRQESPAKIGSVRNLGLLKSKASFDIIVLTLLAATAFAAATSVDLLEAIYQFTRAHEDWELDELIIVPVVLVPTFALFALRRWIEATRSAEVSRLALAELKRSQGLLRNVIDHTPIAIGAVDTKGTITLAEGKGIPGMKVDLERMVGHSVFEIFSHYPDFLSASREAIGGQQSATTLYTGEHVFDCTFAPLLSPKGERNGASLVAMDVTEQKRKEKELLRAQKMDALGKLTAGVAHDFNNLLTVMMGNTSMMLADVPEGNILKEPLKEIHQTIEKASALNHQLLAFSRKQIVQPTVLNLNSVVSDTEKMLLRIIGEDISLVTRMDPELHPVMGDPSLIEQIIMNLVVNARDAMPRGGKLTIQTENVVLGEKEVRRHAEVDPGAYVMLAISDTGHGMDEAVEAHIFEPFFTTKEEGKGTGLGLSTVYGIVKQNDGHIWLYSEPGEGTVFKIYFPQVEGEVSGEIQEKRNVALIPGSETVIVVEDQGPVRRVVRRILEKAHYTVLEACTAGEAFQIFEQKGDTINLLITDVIMPEMGGPEMAKRLLSQHPDLKVLCMSGYTADAVVRHGMLEADFEFLEKPFSPERLTLRVREVLDKPSAGWDD